jgi:hypothetical protein
MTYPIPNEALDDRLGWSARPAPARPTMPASGVERLLLQSGARVVIVDPLGVWWGLRLRGGRQAIAVQRSDLRRRAWRLALNEQAGALIGETVATMAESCIVDLSGLGTKAAERRFMLAFLEALYRHVSGEPVHLVFDEADMWAPQRLLDNRRWPEAAGHDGDDRSPRSGQGLHPVADHSAAGRAQQGRAQPGDGLIAFKLTASQDRDAIGAWIEGQADRRRARRSWPRCRRCSAGRAWSGSGRGILETVAIPAKATFDSSRTPKRGERKRQESEAAGISKA